MALKQRQHPRDSNRSSRFSHPRPANLDGPQAQCKTPLLAVTVAIPGLFQSVTLCARFSLALTTPSLPAPTDPANARVSLPEQIPPAHSYKIPFDSSFPQYVFSFIGVSFLCLLQQAAFRFEFTKGYAYLFPISTLFAVRCSLAKENRQLEKLHSTLKGVGAVHCFSDFFIFSSWLKVRPTVVYPFLRK